MLFVHAINFYLFLTNNVCFLFPSGLDSILNNEKKTYLNYLNNEKKTNIIFKDKIIFLEESKEKIRGVRVLVWVGFDQISDTIQSNLNGLFWVDFSRRKNKIQPKLTYL